MRNRKKKLVLKWIMLITAFVLISISVFAGYTNWKLNQFFEKTSEPPIINPADDNSNPKQDDTNKKSIEELPLGMVLIGIDSRPETGSLNTDAIIVTVLNPETNKVTMLSIPRDTRVVVPNYGETKVNAVYSIGEREKRRQENNGEQPTTSGAYLLTQVLSDYFGIPIQYYARVDFKGFELIIDEVDGIEVNVERDMRYYSAKDGTNINLKKGLQVLNGKQALDYARFRKSSDGNDSSDFERNERHQIILKAISEKLASLKGISNAFDILDIAGDHLRTNFQPDEMKALFWKYKSVRPSDIQTIKMNSYWKNPFVYVDEDELIRVQGELKNAFGDSVSNMPNQEIDNNDHDLIND